MLVKNRQDEIKAISQCLKNYEKFSTVDESHLKGISELIEMGIYNHSVRKSRERHIPISWQDQSFVEIYSNISYNVKVNLDVKSSVNEHHSEKIKTYLASKMYEFHVHQDDDSISVANRIIIPESLGAVSSVELNPHINQVYLDEINLREQQGIVMKFSKMYRCDRCGKRKTRVREIQSASLDEGSTLFITCIGCGNRWRQYS